MTETAATETRILYWHRELPPLTAEGIGEYTLEATSSRLPVRFSRADEEWGRCYGDLMTKARARMEQEVVRLGGHYAHVGEELISPQHDDALGEAWLYGRFKYVLYRLHLTQQQAAAFQQSNEDLYLCDLTVAKHARLWKLVDLVP